MDQPGKEFRVRVLVNGRRQWQRRLRQWRAFRHMALRFMPYMRKQAGRLALALACAQGYMLLRILEPWPIKLIFDNVLFDRRLSPFFASLLPHGAENRLLLLNILVVAIIVISVIQGLLYFCQQILIAKAGQ
jgi:ATP-binding cassette, subfamily B, bacterial